MLIIPFSAVPSQTLTVLLAQQQCQMKVYDKGIGVFLDLYLNNVPVVTGVICRDRVKLVRETYLGFMGDLAFMDAMGTSDPVYSGLGTRYKLIYLEASDL